MKVRTLIASLYTAKLEGDPDLEVEKVVSIDDALKETEPFLTWCNNKNSFKLQNLKYGAVIVAPDTYDNLIKRPDKVTFIIADNPRRAFQKILAAHYRKRIDRTISDRAIISSESSIGTNVFIGHNVVISENCVIGNNSIIYHNTVLLPGTIVGSNVTIGANCTIGGVGFGYEKNEDGNFELIPHLGNVVIEDNVEIGNNSCIDRAVLGSTLIRENVKIDNLVHIAHGVSVGENSVVIANAMIAGSVKVGRNTWIAPSASVKNGIAISHNALIGLGAVVLKDVSENQIVIGNPGRPLKK